MRPNKLDIDFVRDVFTSWYVELTLRAPVCLEDKDDWFGREPLRVLYSIRQGYGMFVGKSYQPAIGDFGCWSTLWSICMPTNIKNFIWRCTRGILLVCAVLLQHRVDTDGVCLVCEI